MASRDSLEMRKTAATNVVQVSRDDTPVAIRIRKIGTESATSVTVTTATNIVLVGSTTTDTVTFATYTTVGAVVDQINSTGRWEAVVLDALRANVTTASNFVTGAITSGNDMNGVVVWDVLTDTSVTDYMDVALSLHRDFDYPTRGHRVTLREIQYNVDVSAAEANSVRVYIRNGKTETQVYGVRSVDATATTISWASGIAGITGPDNADIIVRVRDTTSITDAAANYVQAAGLLE